MNKNPYILFNMKNSIYVLIIALFALVQPVQAQHFEGGILGGLLSSQVDGDMAAGYNKVGIQAGAFIQYKLYDKITLHGEMRFIMKGALENRAKTDGYYYQSKLNYVEMPFTVLVKKGRFNFEGGVALGVLVSSSEEDAYGELNLGTYYPGFERLEVSAIGGFFYDVSENFKINFRMQYSMTPVRVRITDNVQTLYRYQKYAFNNLLSFGMYYFIR